jgi:imidazoleglycerol-phosphate dehydratase/histidinol-phosphatase
MLDQIARHGSIDLEIVAKGDLHIDEHHTIEDTGIALGEVFAAALGNKMGIERYGFCLPMDDCLAQAAIDFGGRNWIVWDADFKREKVGDVPTEMFYHFFKSFSDASKSNLNIKAEGQNEHHKIEAIFKAFAKAIKVAVKRDVDKMVLPSTKGAWSGLIVDLLKKENHPTVSLLTNSIGPENLNIKKGSRGKFLSR